MRLRYQWSSIELTNNESVSGRVKGKKAKMIHKKWQQRGNNKKNLKIKRKRKREREREEKSYTYVVGKESESLECGRLV